MKYRLWNKTTQKWVKDDEGRVCEFDNVSDAVKARDQVIDIQQVNPDHRLDEIAVSHTSFHDESH